MSFNLGLKNCQKGASPRLRDGQRANEFLIQYTTYYNVKNQKCLTEKMWECDVFIIN